MKSKYLPAPEVEKLLKKAATTRVLVVGDVMLDQFIWGHVSRISPEAPVPVVDFERENYMPGGAANVARNLADLGVSSDLFAVIGNDDAGEKLKSLLKQQQIGCSGLIGSGQRATSIKTRIVAHQQQVVRLDRETKKELDQNLSNRLLAVIRKQLSQADAVIVGDYGKGIVTQYLLDELKTSCSQKGIWLSLDPKPVHKLDLRGLSLMTPNRKEAFELAQMEDHIRDANPLKDKQLTAVADKLLNELQPALLLITLGDQGMLLCQRNEKPFHIPTVAQEVFDVSGAGDTVIATFTFAVAAGASPLEAAVFSNHAAGVVVGKVGTATVHPTELLKSFE
ncbi:MAG: D-glycero-beta-D-manno-heptose-7-phosphate kinase [Verrucomicrobiales bacterium]|nr:D-glycero-beta-D-manno-heptose-7-phosphate kinase [Verrucomicrobiales bacterium]